MEQLLDFKFPPNNSKENDAGGEASDGSSKEEAIPGTSAWSKTQSKAKPNKFNCSICKKTTTKVPTNRDGGVRCGVCQFWWHPKCLNMDPSLVNWILMGMTVAGLASTARRPT